MDATEKPLIIRLFSFFPTPEHEESLDDLLRSSRLEVTRETVRTLDGSLRDRPLSRAYAWLREAVSSWTGPAVLLVWYHRTLADTLSSLGTMDRFVPVLRGVRKVVVVPDLRWEELPLDPATSGDGWLETRYHGLDERDEAAMRPVFVLRLDPRQRAFRAAVELGIFLGTRTSRRSAADLPVIGADEDEPTTTGPPTPPLGVSSRPAREDETLEAAVGMHPLPVRMRRMSSGAVEVRRLGSGRPDPRCEDEDLRDTIEPPPPLPPGREDPTKPKF